MLGDTAVAVHPDDDRYKKYHGKKIILPLVNREIPIITDEEVDRDFGTGAVKVTPAHDPVDFELGKRHGLEQVIVIDGSGRMTDAAGEEFQGLDRSECREKVLLKLHELGLLTKTEDYQHAVGQHDRCKTIIEPLLSWQWFVKIAPLAKEAIREVKEGRIQFIPSNWAKTYFEWMYNIHDWCISRQLWWGHRIPAWYCQDCENLIVAIDEPTSCGKCQSKNLVQEEDVLDTWFSSALWPFATIGWPDETEDLKTFYPTDLMSTGFDIIFFWVARMIMMGLKFMGDIPFRHVFINGLVRDFKRRKMSKSEGNIIDPLEMIGQYGTDALRFTLAAMAIPGMDLALSEERMAGYRAFANKIWNASRFVLLNLDDGKVEISEDELTIVDRWIRSRLDSVINDLNEALEEYKFYEAADRIYHFVWHEFCDWYLELVKPNLSKGNRTSQSVLIHALDQILRLLHPFMPFITEEIWQHLPASGRSLLEASFPQKRNDWDDKEAETVMGMLQGVIVEVRTLRAENRIPPKKQIDLWLKIPEKGDMQVIEQHQIYIRSLANVATIEIYEDFPRKDQLLRGISGSIEMAIPLEEGLVDLEKEIKRLEREYKKIEKEIGIIKERLQNKGFISRAPEEVIQDTREKLILLEEKREKVHRNLNHVRKVKVS
jgi:valyl-tRNA synthetase